MALSAEPEERDDPTHRREARACIDRYWRRNVAFMAGLLFVWAGISLGCGVLLAESLNRLSLGGFPLGFWFAQQGSILGFVALILVYAVGMTRLDRAHHAELEALAHEAGKEAGPRAVAPEVDAAR